MVGPPKVGKTALIHELAWQIAKRKKEKFGGGREIWLLSPMRLGTDDLECCERGSANGRRLGGGKNIRAGAIGEPRQEARERGHADLLEVLAGHEAVQTHAVGDLAGQLDHRGPRRREVVEPQPERAVAEVIHHHREGIAMVEPLLPHLTGEVRQMADRMVAEQRREIEEFERKAQARTGG